MNMPLGLRAEQNPLQLILHHLFSLFSLFSSPSSQCELEIWNVVDMCVDLVLNSKTLRNTERKAEVTKIEKVEVEDEVEVVTREAYDKSLESFLVAVDTLHSTLFREGKEVECSGMNKYLRLSPLSSSSSSSPTCERFDAEDQQEEVEKEKEKEVVASQQGRGRGRRRRRRRRRGRE